LKGFCFGYEGGVWNENKGTSDLEKQKNPKYDSGFALNAYKIRKVIKNEKSQIRKSKEINKMNPEKMQEAEKARERDAENFLT
jgi:tellurite resistance protein